MFRYLILIQARAGWGIERRAAKGGRRAAKGEGRLVQSWLSLAQVSFQHSKRRTQRMLLQLVLGGCCELVKCLGSGDTRQLAASDGWVPASA